MSVLDRYRQHIKEEEERTSTSYAEEKKIKQDLPNILRIVDPEGAVEYFESWMLCDDGQRRPFIIENDHEGKSILSELLGDRENFYHGGILDSRLDEYKQKYMFYEQQDPELINIVAFNGDKSENSGSWRPRRQYAFNCIDREVETEGNLANQNWCQVNQHTKIIKMGSTGLQSLLDVRDNCGNLEDYDINFKKTGSGKKNTRYNVMKVENHPTVVVGAISEAERKYKLYDLKIEAKLSPAGYILKYLEKTIARIDSVLGTNYLSQLQEQSKLEGSYSTTPVQTVSSPPVQAESRIPSNQNSVQSQDTMSMPPIQPPHQKVAQSVQDSAPVRTRGNQVVQSVNMILCPFCKNEVSSDNEYCPNCNKKLLEACEDPKCKKPFLVTLDTCPYCGKVYKLG